jgi:hypothetical protein
MILVPNSNQLLGKIPGQLKHLKSKDQEFNEVLALIEQ